MLLCISNEKEKMGEPIWLSTKSTSAPQPCSKAPRDIARSLEERESGARALEQLAEFLIRSGIPVKEPCPTDEE